MSAEAWQAHLVEPEPEPSWVLVRFGSFTGSLGCSRDKYLTALQNVFGVGLSREPAPRHPEFELRIVDAPAPASSSPETNLLALGGSPLHPTITTDALRVSLALDRAPRQIRIEVLEPDLPLPPLTVHFVVVIHKLLFLLDRVVLHAAAVSLNGRTSLFVGEKGAGKSTLCLSLARAGGTVLGEDVVVLRRPATGFLVSGGDERSRLTEPTERHFFPAPLAVPARDFAGTLKKEIRRGDFIASRPYQDVPVHRLYFPRITGTCRVGRLRAQPALLRLLAANGHFQRFAGPADQACFLGWVADFIGTVSRHELELSYDLAELDRFVATLVND